MDVLRTALAIRLHSISMQDIIKPSIKGVHLRGGGRVMIEQFIAEATECDFKVAVEKKRPKSWLKSVSAFSNGIGGTLLFGVDDNKNIIGLPDVKSDSEAISRLIKERITPLPQFVLRPYQQDGKDLLALEVPSGRSTPFTIPECSARGGTGWKRVLSLMTLWMTKNMRVI